MGWLLVRVRKPVALLESIAGGTLASCTTAYYHIAETDRRPDSYFEEATGSVFLGEGGGKRKDIWVIMCSKAGLWQAIKDYSHVSWILIEARDLLYYSFPLPKR